MKFETLEDEMNAEIREVEKAIVALDLGVAAMIFLPEVKVTLAFGKIDGRWHLYVIPKEGGHIDLTSAPREVRLAAIPQIPKLVGVLRETRGQTDEEVKSAITFLRGCVEQLRGGR